MDHNTMISQLKKQGIQFTERLTDVEIYKIQEIYDIKFPESLHNFYSIGLPLSEDEDYFPRWTDFSDENIAKIKERIEAPIRRLLFGVKRDFWLPKWGERPESENERIDKFMEAAVKSPRLIPVYSHRYIPQIDGVKDPPVISTVGQDTVYIGSNLEEYLHNEFLRSEQFSISEHRMYIPFWSDIINHCIEADKEKRELRKFFSL